MSVTEGQWQEIIQDSYIQDLALNWSISHGITERETLDIDSDFAATVATAFYDRDGEPIDPAEAGGDSWEAFLELMNEIWVLPDGWEDWTPDDWNEFWGYEK